MLRSAAWRLCLDEKDRPSFRSLVSAYFAGDAVGNVTPFGVLISEPSKVMFVRPRIDVEAAVAALTVENLFYIATIALVLVAGTGALLISVGVSRPVEVISVGATVFLVTLALMATWIISTRRRVISGLAAWMIRRRLAVPFWEKHLPWIRQSGDRIFGFTTEHRSAVVPVLALELCYQLAAILEIWYVISLITGERASLLLAFVLEYVNRTITIAFQFVPMWMGVDEAGTGLTTNALGLGSAAGVSLALVRKARIVVWTVIGLALLVHRGLWLDTTPRDAMPLERRSSQGTRR
jgi:hypothetical protein